MIIKIFVAFILTFVLVSINSFVSMASVTESDESFTISNGVLTAYSGADEGIVIPEGVTEIKASFFCRQYDNYVSDNSRNGNEHWKLCISIIRIMW